MLKLFHYFMKLSTEYNYFFVNAWVFLQVMVVWCIKNNDFSTASLNFKFFKTLSSFIGLISADIPSFSTNYDYIFFRKIINLEVRKER